MPRARKKPPAAPADLVLTASDRQALAEGCYFDEPAADRVVRFIGSFCCHTKGKWYGKPFRLLGWQVRLLRLLYGWKRVDGTRRFRQVYVEIPKKNGKTELVSALAIYHLLADGEMGGEIYLCASTRKQAGLVFKDAVMMIESSPELKKRLAVKDSFHEKTIDFKPTRSRLEVMSSDAPSADGKSSSLTIFDELHRQENAELWNVMEFAGAAREQPILFSITTAGVDRLSVCYKQREHAERVARGEAVDVAFLGLIYGADESDDLDSPATWARCNPSWGETIKPQDFAREHAKAKGDPVQFLNFARLRLNVWTQPDARFVDLRQWDACAAPFDPAELLGKPCYAGLDLSNVSDITAEVLAFPWEGDAVRVLCRFWVPEEYAKERQAKDGVPYLDWARRGFITLTKTRQIDYDFIARQVIDDAKTYKLKKLNADPWNSPQVCLKLAAEGLNVELMRQGFVSMNAPCKELLRLVGEGKLLHGGNPVLAWMARNARALSDPGENLKISKKHSKDKVDGMVALAMALSGVLAEKPRKKSVYDRRGIETV
jgi:phage terminase large subunit-like protein